MGLPVSAGWMAGVRHEAAGAGRTLDGLADFAIVQSYLSTAAKWGLRKLDALR